MQYNLNGLDLHDTMLCFAAKLMPRLQAVVLSACSRLVKFLIKLKLKNHEKSCDSGANVLSLPQTHSRELAQGTSQEVTCAEQSYYCL